MTVVFGTNSADSLPAAAATDTVFGLAGNDTLSSNFATADLHGGLDNDLILIDYDYVFAANGLYPDTQWLLYGDDGNDTITASVNFAPVSGYAYYQGTLPDIDIVADGGNGDDYISLTTLLDAGYYTLQLGYYDIKTINNTVTDFSGNNSIYISSEIFITDEPSLINTSVSLGSGNDTVTVYENVFEPNLTGVSSGQFDLGEGNNTLNIDQRLGKHSISVTSGSGVDVVNLNLDLDHGNSNSALVILDIHTGAGNDAVSVLTYSARYSGYDFSSGVIDLGDGDDTLTIKGTNGWLYDSPYAPGGAYTVYGGNGNDTVSVAIDGNASNVPESDVIFDLGAGNDAFSGVIFNSKTSILAGAGDDVISLSLQNIYNAYSTNIDLGAGNNNFSGSIKDSSVSISAGTGNDSVTLSWQALGYYYSSPPPLSISINLSDGNNVLDLDLSRGNLNAALPMLSVTTGAGADYIDVSGGANNVISTGAGNDTIVGFGGIDIMTGGDGDDTYTVDNVADQVIETNATAAGGADTVLSWLTSYTLGANVEKGRIMLSGNANLTGNALNNALFAGDGNNILDGGAGTADSASYRYAKSAVAVSLAIAGAQATGGSGTDTLLNIEHLGGSLFNDTLTGSSIANWIGGEDGDDIIMAGGGNDSLVGGIGNDSLTGGTGDDLINAGDGDDVLIYGTGSNGFDAVDGGLGNDRIVVNANNVTIGLSSIVGIEQISAAGFSGAKILGSAASDSFDFSAVTLTGITSIDAGSGNDTVTGSAGDDIILAGAGNDLLKGGGGNDTFRVGASSGTDIFDGGAGTDRIEASANNVTLTVTGSNITGVEAISSAGFTGFTLAGTSAANNLNFSGMSLSGVSRINGGSGNDTIVGSAGNDVIEGNVGKDILTGGLGADTFDFNVLSHSKGSNIDLITDFTRGQDLIDLSTIDAKTTIAGNDAFSFIGSSAFSGVAGQLRYDTTSIAGVTRVLADTNGDKIIDLEIHLTGTHALTASDFLL
jgi:Ca2+-binding RTX toxin-like protein